MRHRTDISTLQRKKRKITTILTYLSYSVSLDESRNPLENEKETKQK